MIAAYHWSLIAIYAFLLKHLNLGHFSPCSFVLTRVPVLIWNSSLTKGANIIGIYEAINICIWAVFVCSSFLIKSAPALFIWATTNSKANVDDFRGTSVPNSNEMSHRIKNMPHDAACNVPVLPAHSSGNLFYVSANGYTWPCCWLAKKKKKGHSLVLNPNECV